MIRESTSLIVGVVLVLALVAVAQPPEFREGGFPPTMVPPPPVAPGPGPALMKEYAEQLRVRAREAQELADRLRRQADELDQMVKRQVDRGPGEMEGVKRELAEIKEATGRAQREGRWEKVEELRQRASHLLRRFQPLPPAPRPGEREEVKRQIERLREEARRAKEEGRPEQSKRMWQDADRLEQKLREQAFDRPGPEAQRQEVKSKIERLRDESRRAKDQGRFEEADRLWKDADRLEQQLREKDEMAARGVQEPKKREMKEPGPPYKDELMRGFEDLKREIGRLWQALNEMRSRPPER